MAWIEGSWVALEMTSLRTQPPCCKRSAGRVHVWVLLLTALAALLDDDQRVTMLCEPSWTSAG